MPSGCRRSLACKTWLEQSSTISPESMHESLNMGSPADLWLRYWRQRDLREAGQQDAPKQSESPAAAIEQKTELAYDGGCCGSKPIAVVRDPAVHVSFS